MIGFSLNNPIRLDVDVTFVLALGTKQVPTKEQSFMFRDIFSTLNINRPNRMNKYLVAFEAN